MNENLFVKLEATLSIDEWNLLLSMLVSRGTNDYELEVINKLQTGAVYDIAPDIDIDLPM